MQKVNESECEYRGGDWGVKYFMRGPRIDWGVIYLKPGQEMGEHGHAEVEETFYVLEGSPKLLLDGEPHQTSQGDVFRVEAPERHNLVNDTDTPAKIVFIKVPYLPHDKT